MLFRKIVTMAFVFLFLSFCAFAQISFLNPEQEKLFAGKKSRLEMAEVYIRDKMKYAKIPGLAVVIIKNGTVMMKKGFGFANKRLHRPVMNRTLFELGSTSKAFTGLGILYLIEKDQLKLDDSIKKYIPWLDFYYIPETGNPTIDYFNRRFPYPVLIQKKQAEITIRNLLMHTSGIPQKTLAKIPAGTSLDMLEKTIRKINGTRLLEKPGLRYNYATVNYDVLALVMEKISGLNFEQFIKEKILKPLELNNTYLFHAEAEKLDMSTGYKVSFFNTLEFKAPIYRGNTAAGYYITNADDLSRWLMLQLNVIHNINPEAEKLIFQSHNHNDFYQYGWKTGRTSRYRKIYHAGSNPNYSSYIEFRPEEKIGVAVMANMNSSVVSLIGEGLINLLNDRGRIPDKIIEPILNLDKICSITIIVLLYFIFITSMANIKNLKQNLLPVKKILKHKKKFYLLTAILMYACYQLITLSRSALGYGWQFVLIWGPFSFPGLVILLFIEILLLYLYLLNFDFSWKNLQKGVQLLK